MGAIAILQASFWSNFTNINKPLALAGLFAAIIFLIARQILKNYQPADPGQRHGYELARTILKYLFILALVAMFLGTAGYLAALVINKPQPKPASDLNSAENEASRLEDQVMILKSSWENSAQSPADKQKVVTEGPKLAQQFLAINDRDLRPAWRVLKYEYTLYAYTMAATDTAATNDREKQVKLDLIAKALQAGKTATDLINDVKRNYTTSDDYKKAMNYIQREEVEDRVYYLSAICLCRRADVLRDENSKKQARDLIAKISAAYLNEYPVESNPELKNCIPTASPSP